MDCRKTLVLALGLSGVAGCVPDNSVRPPPGAPPALVEKAKDPPRHPPKHPETLIALGNFYATSAESAPQGSAQQERLFDQARKQYEQALEIDANCLAAFEALGKLHVKMGDPDGAVTWYRKGLEKQPKEASLWLDLGMCHARRKDWPPAIDALRRAADLDPENRQNWNMLGSCLVRAGHPDEAFAAFRKGGGEARAHYHMAFMLHHMKQDDEARSHLQAALQADPRFEAAERLLAQLDGRAPADPAVMPAAFELPAESPQR
ncbi:MAG TPA: tetratricopeptide repeat protein [Gemmataceae bacterium]|nr:tetratricopeptide repeat protein [Gemmataceae bacterium]